MFFESYGKMQQEFQPFLAGFEISSYSQIIVWAFLQIQVPLNCPSFSFHKGFVLDKHSYTGHPPYALNEASYLSWSIRLFIHILALPARQSSSDLSLYPPFTSKPCFKSWYIFKLYPNLMRFQFNGKMRQEIQQVFYLF